MITPRIKPSGFSPEEAPDDMFVQRHFKPKMAAAVDVVRPRADRSKGGPPASTSIGCSTA
ncbi:hypothetical protein LRH25_08585 [Ideonella azotifigens]|uniref:Uncharacterized protein n=1 Tax=Ideonella azotifigens TaxID=513160 RepID=A0ABN1KGE7_9BURK|nr:hypothetical protein [Ideonella azotifigens]MCD2340399.1 hypothetical protein [Ideonella azotifigens]